MRTPIISDIINNIWENNIPEYYKQGKITLESQLQSYLFHHLMLSLPPDCTVWAEPMLYLGEDKKTKIMPDLVITQRKDEGLNGNLYEPRTETILAVIEIKYDITQEVNIDHDIKKLLDIEEYPKNKEIGFGFTFKPEGNANTEKADINANADENTRFIIITSNKWGKHNYRFAYTFELLTKIKGIELGEVCIDSKSRKASFVYYTAQELIEQIKDDQ